MPYNNVPKSDWDKMDRCVDDVMAKQKLGKKSAIAICYTSIVKHEAVPLYEGGCVVEGHVVDTSSAQVAPVSKTQYKNDDGLITCRLTNGGRQLESATFDSLGDCAQWFIRHGIKQIDIKKAADGSLVAAMG